jgi:hypothetical protein
MVSAFSQLKEPTTNAPPRRAICKADKIAVR